MTDYPAIDPRYLALLGDFKFESLQNDGGTIYGLWSDITLAYVNLEWTRFSKRNGGDPQIHSEWTLGRCVLDAISEPLRPFFAENYRRCLQEGRPWEHVYECSSADFFRQFHMTTFPLGKAEGLLVVNSLRRETVYTGVSCQPLDELYRNEHDIITQCSHCRRVRRNGDASVWDWVPDWVTNQPPKTSHGLCEPCIGFYYAPQRTSGEGFAESFSTLLSEPDLTSRRKSPIDDVTNKFRIPPPDDS